MSRTQSDSHLSSDDLIQYVYRELPQQTVDHVEQHVASCEPCSRELAEMESTRSAVERIPVSDVDAATWDRMTRKAMAEQSLRNLMRWAAVILVAIGTAIGFRALRLRSDDQHQVATSGALRLIALAGATDNRSGDSASVDMLMQSLEHDPSPNVRLAAIDALNTAPADSRAGIKVLSALIREPSPPLRLAMIDLIVHLNPQGVREGLQSIARDDPDPSVRATAAAAASGGSAQ